MKPPENPALAAQVLTQTLKADVSRTLYRHGWSRALSKPDTPTFALSYPRTFSKNSSNSFGNGASNFIASPVRGCWNSIAAA